MNEDKHNQQSNKDGKKGGGIKTRLVGSAQMDQVCDMAALDGPEAV